MPQWLRHRPILAATLAMPLMGYVGTAGTMAVQQRQMLFETDDGGLLAAAGGMAIAGSERVTLTTSDGESIAGWYVAPKPGQPVMLFLHGQGGRLVRQTGRWDRIRKAGLGVLAISYRGYPGSSGRPSESGLVRDARAAYDWLLTRHAAKDIVIHGHSLGSGVAVLLAAQPGIAARALVLEAPFTAAVDIAGERMPIMAVSLLMLDQFRSRDVIGQVHCPVLIIHGDRDTVIPVSHAIRLHALANAPKSLVRLPNSNHNTLVRDGLYDIVTRFLQETGRS